MGDLQNGNVGITGFDGSQVVVDVVETFDEIHEHANDLFEVRRHQVEQYLAVFAARIKRIALSVFDGQRQSLRLHGLSGS